MPSKALPLETRNDSRLAKNELPSRLPNGAVVPCHDASEARPLCPELQLFLKPDARAVIRVDLPELADMCRSISNWEVMEQLRSMIRREKFASLKVTRSSLSGIEFEAEFDTHSSLCKALKILDDGRIKLSGFADLLQVRASELRSVQPGPSDWESHFAFADNGRPGERADTLKIGRLPSRWFADESGRASPELVARAFAQLAPVRRVHVPALDTVDEAGVGSSDDGLLEAFVQFVDCAGFASCMRALRNSRLMRRDPLRPGAAFSVLPTVDFDRSGHLSDRSVHRRRRLAERRAEAAIAEARRLAAEKAAEEERQAEAERRAAEEAAARAAEAAEAERLRREQLAAEAAAALKRRLERQRRRELTDSNRRQSLLLLTELLSRSACPESQLSESALRRRLARKERRLRESLLQRVKAKGGSDAQVGT